MGVHLHPFLIFSRLPVPLPIVSVIPFVVPTRSREYLGDLALIERRIGEAKPVYKD